MQMIVHDLLSVPIVRFYTDFLYFVFDSKFDALRIKACENFNFTVDRLKVVELMLTHRRLLIATSTSTANPGGKQKEKNGKITYIKICRNKFFG